jgi:hypothetical protein
LGATVAVATSASRHRSLSGTTTVDGVDDVEEFGAVQRAMGTVGVA